MNLPPEEGKPAPFNVVVQEIHDNTSTEIIIIAGDKLRLALNDHAECLNSNKNWHTPASLLVGVIIVFCTSEFKRAFGLSADTWSAAFLMFGGICIFWLLKCARDYRKGLTVASLIEIIKNKSDKV